MKQIIISKKICISRCETVIFKPYLHVETLIIINFMHRLCINMESDVILCIVSMSFMSDCTKLSIPAIYIQLYSNQTSSVCFQNNTSPMLSTYP